MRRALAIATAAIALLALGIEPALAAAPAPLLARTVVVRPAGGRVDVKPRGGPSFKLRKATAIPVGSTVDTTRGKVKLTTADGSGGTQSGMFSRGSFLVTQMHSGLTDLKLTGGDFSACSAARAAGRPLTGAAARRRQLFGNAHGHFRTRGRNSSATVRGTEWLTEDRCDGTATHDMRGQVNTRNRGIEFDLQPGQKVTYYCNKLTIEPDTYCVILLSEPANGIYGAGILTQLPVSDYDLCVDGPDGSQTCTTYPLSSPDESGFRQSAVACPTTAGGGNYIFTWRIGGQSVFPEFTEKLRGAAFSVPCQRDP